MLNKQNHFSELENKIETKKAKVAVIGLGYVGLPLALALIKKGFFVFGLDVDEDRVKKIKQKKSYITDVSNHELKEAISSKRFFASCDFSKLKETDVVIICVPTPLKLKYRPDISYILGALRQIKKYLHPGELIILESTTYPGTTEEIILPLLNKTGLKCGQDFFLAFSPERIDPGNTKFPLFNIPKVIGGITPESTKLAALLYRNIVKKVVLVSSARVAETVKLLENTFRIVNIGLIDEIAMMCHKMNIDIWEIIEAAKTKPFGFMPFYPGPGVGGHCIPKDPLYLYWKARKYGFYSRFIKLASDIINFMPEYVVERIEGLLKNAKRSLSQTRILVVGVTYKKDVKDLRKSPALDVIEILQKRKAKISYYDPIIPYLKLNNINLKAIEFNPKDIAIFDCVVIITDHTNVDYKMLLKNAKLIFDTRNVYKGVKSTKIFRL